MAPDSRALGVVEAGAHLAGNAIERLTAEKKLRESAERLKLAEEAACFGIWELDVCGSLRYDVGGSGGHIRFRRGSPAKKRRGKVKALIHPDDWASTRAARARDRREGNFRNEFRSNKAGRDAPMVPDRRTRKRR